MDVYMEPLPVIPFIEPDRGIRQSVQIATDDDFIDETDTVNPTAPIVITISPCGAANAEVDQDGDGDVDWCRNLGGTAYRGTCPALLVAVDQDGDGSLDRCIAQARPDTAIDPNVTTTTAPADVDLLDPDGDATVPDTNEPQTPAEGEAEAGLPPIVPQAEEPAPAPEPAAAADG